MRVLFVCFVLFLYYSNSRLLCDTKYKTFLSEHLKPATRLPRAPLFRLAVLHQDPEHGENW